MPELPEVETMRRGVAPIEGSRIAAVERPPCRLRPIRIEPGPAAFRRRAVGATVVRVGRAGKRVLLELDRGDRVVFEPRMTGLLLLADPPDPEHLRLRLRLEGGSAPELLFWDRRGLGTVRLLDPAAYERELGPEQLGPDALLVDGPLLRERLGTSARPVKVALLDQRALAGVGNIYASEALHGARIHPARPCRSLRPREWTALADELRAVLEAAVLAEGSTLGDGTYRNALNQDGSYQNQHRVYAREGEPCRSCGKAEVVRTVLGQRATFHCPRCQGR